MSLRETMQATKFCAVPSISYEVLLLLLTSIPVCFYQTHPCASTSDPTSSSVCVPRTSLFAAFKVLLYGVFPSPGPQRSQLVELLTLGSAELLDSVERLVQEIDIAAAPTAPTAVSHRNTGPRRSWEPTGGGGVMQIHALTQGATSSPAASDRSTHLVSVC